MLEKRENLFSFFELNGGSAWRVQKIRNTIEGREVPAGATTRKIFHGLPKRNTAHTICSLGTRTRKQSPKFFQNGGLTLRGILSPAKNETGGRKSDGNDTSPKARALRFGGFFKISFVSLGCSHTLGRSPTGEPGEASGLIRNIRVPIYLNRAVPFLPCRAAFPFRSYRRETSCPYLRRHLPPRCHPQNRLSFPQALP